MPSSGQILIAGEDVSTLSATHRDVSMVFQSYALFPHMTVGENVGYGLKIQRVPDEERKARVESALAAVGLSGYGERYIDQLSGGQQQRVAVARAIVLQPKVMLFDEPLSNLDTRLRRQMREDIRRLQEETGITSVYVTHDQGEALAVSDNIIVMSEGRIAQHGSPDSIYRRPVSPFVATFMGEANILPASVISGAEGVAVKVGDLLISVGKQGLVDASPEPGPAQVALRPESVLMSNERPATGGIKGEVTWRSYLGFATEYTVETELGEVFAILPPHERQFQPGETVYIAAEPVGIALLSSNGS